MSFASFRVRKVATETPVLGMENMENQESKVEIPTPMGALKFQGKKMAELIAVLCLCALFVLGYEMWEHKTDMKDDGRALRSVLTEMTDAQKKQIATQREMNCLLAMPQEKREREYYSPNSFCKQMAKD